MNQPSVFTNTQATTRGHLKIFFGYAAGVGKTYAMLEAAQAAEKEGIDVVVGYVEPHDRPETLALLAGLETLAPKTVVHRGITLKEFDLDAALSRHPRLIVVDELAHQNAAGARHAKRYQDVEELLKAGIDVCTTINVQHLESLNDLVASITGITVNERIPDHVFNMASQVELVDIEPDQLVKRMQAGKIYGPRQAQRALENFFTVDNLAALREIAMRRMADQLNLNARQEGNQKSARAGEHILICLSPSPSNAKVIRTAIRMADAFHSGITALYVRVSDDDSMDEQSAVRLKQHISLAEQLGAQIAIVDATDPAAQIAEYARMSGVTKIVMGRINHKQNRFTGQKSLADHLLEKTDLDVYIIPDQQRAAYKRPRPRANDLKARLSWKDFGIMLLCLMGATALGFGFYHAGFSESNIITVYILAVLLTAVLTSWPLYGALASLLSVGAFNFFFTVPRFSFHAYHPDYPITFLIMLLVSFIVGSLAGRVKKQAHIAVQKAYYTELLLECHQKLQTARDEWDALRLAAEQLSRLFDRPILYSVSSKERAPAFRVAPEEARGLLTNLRTQDLAVAQWVEKNNKHAGAGTHTLADAHYYFLAVRGISDVVGIMGLPIEEYDLPDAFEKKLLLAIVGAAGLSQESLRLKEENVECAPQTPTRFT